MFDPARLWSARNPDGGWGYRAGAPSVTEATLFAVLALASGPESQAALEPSLRWIQSRQRADGGWAPRDGIAQSTWVTALPLLLPSSMAERFDVPRAVQWLLDQTGRESGWVFRLRLFLLGDNSGADDSHPAWPWFPETAAWVIPTALTVLALDQVVRRRPGSVSAGVVNIRCNQGRAYLLARRCADGGWNHGSTRALGYDGPSYPETTGLALLALHAVDGLDASLARAAQHAGEIKSLEAACWLRLGLSAHGRPAPALDDRLTPRTNLDLALALIAAAPNSVFVSQV